MMRCVWCRKQTSVEPEEHIFPDSLGCPENGVLRNGEVCKKCNRKNGSLDQALITEFDVFRLMANVPNKKNQPPQIATRPNVEGGYRNGKPFIYVNMDRTGTVSGVNRNLKPFANRPNDLEMIVKEQSSTEVKFTVRQNGVCNSKKCVRGLHKIAFEVFAQTFGVEEALKPRYDAVREYVMRGKGERQVVLAQAGNYPDYRNFAATSNGSIFPIDVVAFQLAVIGFMVDLSPNQSALEAIKQIHREKLGTSWSWVPIHE